jgi:hypothetical protein
MSTTDAQIRELASAIALQASAIANGTVIGPRYAAVRKLAANAEMLQAWTPDDRSGSLPNERPSR